MKICFKDKKIRTVVHWGPKSGLKRDFLAGASATNVSVVGRQNFITEKRTRFYEQQSCQM